MIEGPYEVVTFSPLPYADVERVGWRKTSGAMAEAMLESASVRRVWLVEVGPAGGLRASVRTVSEKLTVVGLPTTLPLERFSGIRRVNRRIQSEALRSALGVAEGARLGWFYDWRPIEIAGLLHWDGLVCEVTDAAEDFAGKGGKTAERLRGWREQCKRECALIVAVADTLKDECSGGRAEVVVEENGISSAFLARAVVPSPRPAEYRSAAGGILLVVGSETSTAMRMDHGLLAETLGLLEDWTLVVVGCPDRPEGALRDLLQHPRVVGLNVLPQLELIPLIQHASVCAVPYRPGPARRDALKTYEYLACGKPVVVTVDTVPTALTSGVRRARSAEEFARACEELADGLNQETVAALRHELERKTWRRRCARLLARIAGGEVAETGMQS